MEESQFFSQLKDFSEAAIEMESEALVVDKIMETEAKSSVDQPESEILGELKVDSDTSHQSTEKEMEIITSEEITDTSTDSHPPSEVLDLQSIFSNVPTGYFDGKGNFNFSYFFFIMTSL